MLFEAPTKDIAVESEQYQNWKPVGQDGGNMDYVEFAVRQNHSFYIDLYSSTLKVWVKIVKADGSPVTSADPVTLTNLPLHSIWSQIDFYLGEHLISRGTYTHYAYKAYLDTLLFTEAVPSKLNAQGYYYDTAHQMGVLDPTTPDEGCPNTGMDFRWKLTKSGKSVAFEGPLHIDMWRQMRYLPSGLDMSLKLFPSQDKFRLTSTEDDHGYKVIVDDVSLKLRMIKLTERATDGLEKTWIRKPMIFPYERSDFSSVQLLQGRNDFSVDSLYGGIVPSKMILAFVSSKAYAGAYTRQAFNFHHYFVSDVAFYVGGVTYPFDALKPNFETDDYLSCFRTIIDGAGDVTTPAQNLGREEYNGGYTIFCLDFCGRRDSNGLIVDVRKELTRLEIRFAKALSEAVHLLIYSKFDSVASIDRDRKIIIQ